MDKKISQSELTGPDFNMISSTLATPPHLYFTLDYAQGVRPAECKLLIWDATNIAHLDSRVSGGGVTTICLYGASFVSHFRDGFTRNSGLKHLSVQAKDPTAQ